MAVRTFRCEYIWLDGGEVEQSLRSKTMVLHLSKEESESINLSDFPVWGFDGSSTMQADTSNSDCVLKPVFACADPNRGTSILVLCEVLNTDFSPHSSNTRAKLIDAIRAHVDQEPVVGFEQEYFLLKDGKPLGWPDDGETPGKQGPYYCAVGSGNVAGRDLVETHLGSCITAGLSITGVNAEVALGQWEYQVGGPAVNALLACDHLWIARYLLQRLGEQSGVTVELDPKPVEGDWNGSGMHTNFSTKVMRSENGLEYIKVACETLGLQSNVDNALNSYGEGIERRLTGEHETCSHTEFRYGVSDRGASIRIPWHVGKSGRGYLEDRRPNSNADPYVVAAFLVSAVCPVLANADDSAKDKE